MQKKASDRNQITIKAMAKVNLGLDVVRRLENGYHEVRMIMQTIDLCDELSFEKAADGITLRTDDERLETDGRNLICRAAELIRRRHPFPGVSITLRKRIPLAAGMAGGSSDAAATFHGLNRLYGLGMDREEMRRLGVEIGADVPYCIEGGTMRAEGIGELLTPLPRVPKARLVVAKPDISVSTKAVYENLHVERITRHPDIDAIEEGIRAGDLSAMCASMGNILETVTQSRYPVIARLKETLLENGAEAALMSGSGPTVFGIFRERRAAERAYAQIASAGLAKQLFVTAFAGKTMDEDEGIG